MLPPKKGNETNTPLAIGGERESPQGMGVLTGAFQRVFDIEKGFNFAQLSVKAKLASIQRTPQKKQPKNGSRCLDLESNI